MRSMRMSGRREIRRHGATEVRNMVHLTCHGGGNEEISIVWWVGVRLGLVRQGGLDLLGLF